MHNCHHLDQVDVQLLALVELGAILACGRQITPTLEPGEQRPRRDARRLGRHVEERVTPDGLGDLIAERLIEQELA